MYSRTYAGSPGRNEKRLSLSGKELFDEISSRYFVADYLSLGLAAWMRRKLIRRTAGKTEPRILDLMCGTGNLLDPVRKIHKDGFSYSGLDHSSGMIEVARKTSGPGGSFHVADVLSGAPLPESDFILSAFGLKCLEEHQYPVLALRMKAALSPGGQVLLAEILFPRSSYLRSLCRFYLAVPARLAALLFTGRPDASLQLAATLENGFDPDKLISALRRAGFDAFMESRLSGSLLFIRAHLNDRQPG